MTHPTTSDHRTGILVGGSFAGAVLLGSTNFLAVRASNRDLDPFWGAGLRFAIAALILLALVGVLRLRLPRGRDLALTAGYGVLGIAVFYALMYWALLSVTGGVAAIVFGVVPLFTTLLAAAHGLERIGSRSVVGAVLALGGIAWLTLGGGNGLEVPLVPLLAMLAASLCISESGILAKRVSHNHPVTTNAVAISTGALVLLVLSTITGDAWVLPRLPEAVLAIGYLSTLGTVGMFMLFLFVLGRWTASATSYITVLLPVTTMLLEAWLLDEPITARGIVAAILVMFGVWFGAISPGARASVQTVPVAESAA
jgi:drug/metabolite transporter (DMT)-like permease